MSLLSTLRFAARKIGLEVHRYNVAQSLDARLFSMIEVHDVDLVIDVGANDGGYGGYLRQGGYNGAICSFEPLKDVHALLKARAAKDNLWTVAPQCALGETEGAVDIHIAGNSKSSSLLPMLQSHVSAAPHSATVGKESVPLKRLDDIDIQILRKSRKAMLKIDTQGYEMPVLLGARETLNHCVGVQLEMSLVPLYEGQVLYRELLDWLGQEGFQLWSLLPGFADLKSGRLLQMDGVFFRS